MFYSLFHGRNYSKYQPSYSNITIPSTISIRELNIISVQYHFYPNIYYNNLPSDPLQKICQLTINTVKTLFCLI